MDRFRGCGRGSPRRPAEGVDDRVGGGEGAGVGGDRAAARDRAAHGQEDDRFVAGQGDQVAADRQVLQVEDDDAGVRGGDDRFGQIP